MRPICWDERIKEGHIVTNLLVCRIKRGIGRDQAAKLFLEMVRPKLKILVKMAVKGSRLDPDVALMDLESKTIEVLQEHYVHGDKGYPLHFLFSPPKGHVFNYARHYAKRQRQFDDVHILESFDPLSDEECHVAYEDPRDEDETRPTETTSMAREVLADGLTLSLDEYRILSFCIENAMDLRRQLNGLHVYLAKVTGMPRSKVTKTYADATGKLVQETTESLKRLV